MSPTRYLSQQVSNKSFAPIAGRLLQRLSSSSVIDLIVSGFSIVRHWRLVLIFLRAAPGSRLNAYYQARSEVLEFVHVSFIAANWDASQRVQTVVSHLETAAQIGGIVDGDIDAVEVAADLSFIGPDYRITLDQPRWLLREGQMAFSLWDGVDRIFSLSFSLSTQDGNRVAYIGGLQGRTQIAGEPDILERYRTFTKAAHGSRPRDFLVDTFRVFCKQIGVVRILAVSDANHSSSAHRSAPTLRYDDVWTERGGVPDVEGFYRLPVEPARRSAEDIPAKKRKLYQQRYDMLSRIEQEMAGRVSARDADEVRPARPAPERQVGEIELISVPYTSATTR